MRNFCLILLAMLISIKSYPKTFINNDSAYYIKGVVYTEVFGKKEIEGGAVVRIKNTGIGSVTDSLGIFEIDRLRSGVYIFQAYGFGTESIDTTITINNESKDNLVLTLPVVCKNCNPDKAKEDIKNNKPKLFLLGSFAPIYYPGQENFENKYGIKYYELGDDLNDPPICYKSYNKIIFGYLDEVFGNAWRKEVRKDVFGFSNN